MLQAISLTTVLLNSLLMQAGPRPRTFDDGLVVPLPSESKVSAIDVVHETDLGTEMPVRVYRPRAAGTAPLPVVLLLNASRPDLMDHPQQVGWSRLIAGSDLGLAVVTHEGRMANGLLDGEEVLTWIRDHGPSHGLQGDNVCVWSCSGNVQMGLPLALQHVGRGVTCAVAYYGAPPTIPKLSRGLPLFVARAGRDSANLNRRIAALAVAAVEADAPLEFHHYGMGAHGFDLLDDTDESARIIHATLAFMKAHLHRDTQREVSAAAAVQRAAECEARQDWIGAIDAYDGALATRPDDAQWTFRRGMAYLSADEPAAALADFRRCGDLGYELASSRYNAACAAALAGEPVVALDLLEAAFEAGFSNQAAARSDADLASLRRDPRFVALTTDDR